MIMATTIKKPRAKRPSIYDIIVMDEEKIIENLLIEIKKKTPNVQFILDMITTPGLQFDVNKVIYQKHQTLLMRACSLNRVEVVKALLKLPDLDINAFVPSYRVNALKCAIISGATESAAELLNHPDINVVLIGTQEQYALKEAADYGRAEIVEMLLQRPDVDINHKSNIDHSKPALESACYQGHTEVVRVLLKHPDIDVNTHSYNNWYPIHWAASNGYVEIIKLLLAHPKIDVNVVNNFGGSAISLASRDQRKEVLLELLKHPNIDVNCLGGDHPVRCAFLNERFDMVMDIIQHPSFNPNVLYSHIGNISNPLYDACRSNQIEIVQELLKREGVDLTLEYKWNRKDKGKTPLQIAMYNNNTEIIKLLLTYSGKTETSIEELLSLLPKEEQ